MKSVPPALDLSGGGTIYHYQGISKKQSSKFLKKALTYLLDPHSMIEKVIADTTLFSGLCYGTETGTTMSEKRGILNVLSLSRFFLKVNIFVFVYPPKSLYSLFHFGCYQNEGNMQRIYLWIQGLDQDSSCKAFKCT